MSCLDVIEQITRLYDDTFTKGNLDQQRQDLYDVFGVNSTVRYFDFMFYIADIFTISVQYGSRTDMCTQLFTWDLSGDAKSIFNQTKTWGDSKGVTFD